MSRVKVVLDTNGVRNVLKSQELLAETTKYAQQLADSAGEGYVTEERNYPERRGVVVKPGDDAAYWDNYYHNTLEKVRAQYK